MKTDSGAFLGVSREHRFSHGRVGDDAAILEAVMGELLPATEVRIASPETLEKFPRRPDWVLSMAKSESVLHLLTEWEKSGTRVFNSPASVRTCYRKSLIACLEKGGIPIPPSVVLSVQDLSAEVTFGLCGRFWLKRADVHSVHPEDVVAVSTACQLARAIDHFQRHGIEEILLQEHVEGEVIKFYGVGCEDYFCAFSGASTEEIPQGVERLASLAREAAAAAGLEIFGGDAVRTGEGRFVIIDLNDWPSFSRCRPAAAGCIARYVNRVFFEGPAALPGS